MEEVFMGIMVMLPLVVIFLLYVRKRREISPSPQEEQDQVRQRETVIRHSNARRMRRRPTAGSTSSSASTRLEVNDAESDDEIPMGDNDPAQSSKKKGKKRLEREAQRQAEEAARESRQIKQDRYAEMRRRKDEEREVQERLMEEEAKARQIMEEEAAAVEFEKWKGDFSVDAEGTNEDEVKESQGMLSDFVDYIKKHKCVPLEDLATEFQLRTQDCINRITSLEKMGRLSGVMDDRGKYIYISLEEMKAVADYIRRQGRVSISHLASKSNQFIDLEPKTEPLLEGSTLDMVDVA